MKKNIYYFSTCITGTVFLIFAFRYIVLGIGLTIEYDEVEEHSYIDGMSWFSWIILSAIGLFFLYIWYYHAAFFSKLYKYKIDKNNKNELQRIKEIFRNTYTHELNDIVWKSKTLSTPCPWGPIYIDEEKEKFINDASIELGRREFEDDLREWKSNIIYYIIISSISFSIGYLWIK